MVGSLCGLLGLFFFHLFLWLVIKKGHLIFYQFSLSLLIPPYLGRLIFEEKRCQVILSSLLSISPSKQRCLSRKVFAILSLTLPLYSGSLPSKYTCLSLSTYSIIFMLLLGLQVTGGNWRCYL